MSPSTEISPPQAIIEEPSSSRRLFAGLVWLVPLAAVGLSIGFAWNGIRKQGPILTIHADHGHGLDPGDDVRYLGIEVGEVQEVSVGSSDDGHHVRIEVQLRADAAGLARAGTEFWVVRPQLSLDSVQGVDTIIGARYLALNPGPEGGVERSEFTALRAAPLSDEIEGGAALEIVLEAPTRFGLQPGAGITYRGVRIGSVVAVGLASDATSVEVSVRVRGAYAQLVREGSVFWETGGFEFGLSLTEGLEVDLDSLRTALIGGIGMATPVNAGDAVTGGARFTLHADVDDDWLDWAPALPLGNDLLPPGATIPKLLRASLSWEKGRVLRTDESRMGWMFVTATGLLGPGDLLSVPDNARDDRATLEVAGRTFDVRSLLSASSIQQGAAPGLALLKSSSFESGWNELRSSHPGSTAQPRRVMSEPENLIIVRAGGRDPVGVDASRIVATEAGMRIDERIPVQVSWHGAACMARRDGAIVGILLVDREGVGRIQPCP